MKEESPIFVSRTCFPIRWSDCDSMKHVNNAKYFTYVEQARMEWFVEIMERLPADYKATSPVVAALNMNFAKPIYFPSVVNVRISASDAGRSSFKLTHEIYVGEDLCAHGACTIVWIDLATNKSIPLPKELADLIPARRSQGYLSGRT